MHGLVNRALQCFLADIYGSARWGLIARNALVDGGGFEAMLIYDDAVTDAVLAAASDTLGKPRDALLEDLGTYLVSHPNMCRLRRLLRYGGDGFVDFLHSLDDLAGRARLAVPDLDMPQLHLHEVGGGAYRLECRASPPDLCLVVLGALRAMADDYGALAFAELENAPDSAAPCQPRHISIFVHSTKFAQGRGFDLSAASA